MTFHDLIRRIEQRTGLRPKWDGDDFAMFSRNGSIFAVVDHGDQKISAVELAGKASAKVLPLNDGAAQNIAASIFSL